MENNFGRTLCELRTARNLSQNELAKLLFVERSTVTNWENGRRIPSIDMMIVIADFFGVEVHVFLEDNDKREEKYKVILIDDEKIILTSEVRVLTETMPNAEIKGFTRPSEAIAYAKENKVSIAFLDIELGKISGLDICRELLSINPCTKVIFLTAYPNYSLEAWATGACGFLVKPLTENDVKTQLLRLRFPLGGQS